METGGDDSTIRITLYAGDKPEFHAPPSGGARRSAVDDVVTQELDYSRQHMDVAMQPLHLRLYTDDRALPHGLRWWRRILAQVGERHDVDWEKEHLQQGLVRHPGAHSPPARGAILVEKRSSCRYDFMRASINAFSVDDSLHRHDIDLLKLFPLERVKDTHQHSIGRRAAQARDGNASPRGDVAVEVTVHETPWRAHTAVGVGNISLTASVSTFCLLNQVMSSAEELGKGLGKCALIVPACSQPEPEAAATPGPEPEPEPVPHVSTKRHQQEAKKLVKQDKAERQRRQVVAAEAAAAAAASAANQKVNTMDVQLHNIIVRVKSRRMVPLVRLHMKLKHVCLRTAGDRSETEVDFELDGVYHNRTISAWEPFLEFWHGRFVQQMLNNDRQCVSFDSQLPLNLNVSSEFLVLA